MPSPRGDETVVFFDVGGVLLRFQPLSAARDMVRAAGFKALRAARKLWTKDVVARIERGELSPREIHRLFCRHSGWSGGFAEFSRLWNAQFALKPRTAALFARVARRHPTYLLSNTNALHYEHMRKRCAFTRQARGAVLSYELACRKPEERIFREALRIARAEASRCVFIDDRAENVAAAERLGFTAIRYRNSRALARRLDQLGLL